MRWSTDQSTPHCGSGIVYQTRVCYSYTASFPTAVSKMWRS